MKSTNIASQLDRDDRAALIRRVRPQNWSNPRPRDIYDLVVVGAGPAGIEAAQYARRLGLSVALVERNQLGGDSLNAGSIPSKTLINSARLCSQIWDAAEFAVSSPEELKLDFAALKARMMRVRARIAEYHAVDRLQHDGVDIFFGDAKFSGPAVLALGGTSLQFRKAIIATGARPHPPNFPGLDKTGYRTSENIFDMPELPERLVVVGGGPLGCELAQAFCRLGSRVTIMQNDPKFLPREERDAAELLSESMARDGVDIMLNTTVVGAHVENGAKFVDGENYDKKLSVPADEILLSIGRLPNVENLDLKSAGVDCDDNGVKVDDFLRTANTSVYAAGDVCMSHKFTNVAWVSARIAVRNAFQDKRMRHSEMMIPWCTYCEPEIAHVGLQVWDAREKSMPVKTYTVMMQDVDRAITDGQDDGFVKIHVRDGTDRILGATIVATRASEMINEMSAVITAGLGMRDLLRVIHTYPAQSEAIRLAALAYEKDHPGKIEAPPSYEPLSRILQQVPVAQRAICAGDSCVYDRDRHWDDLMFTDNPFAGLSALVSPAIMQTFVIVMAVLVAAGTLFDINHKRSAQYFFDNWRRNRGTKTVGGGEMASLALRTAAVEVLAAGEFCSTPRRIAHLLTMYGFLAYAITTIVLVFWYPTPDVFAPDIVPQLWHIGALMVCIGGYWFWFFIRVDVSAEGHSPFRVVRADLFVLSLTASATLALIWAYMENVESSWANVLLGLYLLATLVLFGSVPWSKFSHMFYKPAAAFQKRVENANGSRNNLPLPADAPATLGSARTPPNHY